MNTKTFRVIYLFFNIIIISVHFETKVTILFTKTHIYKTKKTLTELLRFTIMIIIPIIGKIRFQKCLFGDTEHCKDYYVLYGRRNF